MPDPSYPFLSLLHAPDQKCLWVPSGTWHFGLLLFQWWEQLVSGKERVGAEMPMDTMKKCLFSTTPLKSLCESLQQPTSLWSQYYTWNDPFFPPLLSPPRYTQVWANLKCPPRLPLQRVSVLGQWECGVTHNQLKSQVHLLLAYIT